MPKTLIDLPVEAGIYTEQTARGAANQWKDGDKVRFRYGLIEKIGGWSQIPNAIIGLARKLWDWSSLDSRVWVSIGTEAKLYLWNGGTYYDITPLRRTVNLVDPLTTVIGSDLVTVSDASHGAQEGDYVQISGAASVGGIIISGEYQVQSIATVDSYVIQDDQTASSSATGGGTVNINYDISVGLSNSSFGVGWNTGTWSQETWNTPRTVSTTVELLRTWSLDNWGEDLIAVPRGGSMYHWDRGNGPTSRGIELNNAPENINYMIISQRDRHIFALGCTDEFSNQFDPLLIRWCSQEDFDDWIPISTNTAGDLRLFRGSFIQAAIRTRGEILVFTDVSVHQINYLGGQTVYGIQTVGENVSILSPNAAIEVDYRVFFMAESDFYIYDGILQIMPSTVRNRVYENLTISQKEKVFSGLNREFNEVWFFFPGKDPDVWFEDDFATGLLANKYAVQSMTNSDKYSISFNAGGYTEANKLFSSSVYTYIWNALSTSQALIQTPLDWDLEATFSVDTGSTSIWAGPIIHVTDLSGNEGVTGDNIQGYGAEIALNINFGRISRYTTGGVRQTVIQLNLNTLTTPVTLAADVQYGVTITRTATQVLATIYDPTTDTKQEFAAFTLTAQDLIDYTNGGYGFSFADDDSPSVFNPGQTTKLYALRSAPGGLLTSEAGTGTAIEVNQYAIYNYAEQTWSVGTMARTAWADRSPAFNKPYAAGTDMYLYQHETGTDDNGAALPAYAETYDMELPEAGEYESHVDRLIPDFVRLEGSVDLTLKGKKYPQMPDYRVKGPFTTTATTRKHATRIKARQVALRIESDAIGDSWRLGTMRARVAPHGKRT